MLFLKVLVIYDIQWKIYMHNIKNRAPILTIQAAFGSRCLCRRVPWLPLNRPLTRGSRALTCILEIGSLFLPI